VEDRIFSHVHKYGRPKLSGEINPKITTVYKLHSLLGKDRLMWVFGILTQKEDSLYYLEDSTHSIKVSFAELEYADPDAFFTEDNILLCQGHYQADQFVVTRIEHPPLHANKTLRFSVNEQDYFGAYSKLSSQIASEQNRIVVDLKT